MKDKITVVTITYNLLKANREQAFRYCMMSVFSQDYPNVEHIIIDGASDDGTIDLINEYVDKGWCKLYSEPDDGLYDAMNKGIKKASGKYVIFLNSDDYFSNMKALSLLEKKITLENLDFVGASVISDFGEQIDIFKPNLNIFFHSMPFSHQSMLAKTSALKEIGGFNLDYKLGADLDLIIRLILSGYKVSFIEEIIVCYNSKGVSGLNFEKVIKDYSEIFIKNYSSFYSLSFDSANKLALGFEIEDFFYIELKKYIKEKNPDFYEKYFANFTNIVTKKIAIPLPCRKFFALILGLNIEKSQKNFCIKIFSFEFLRIKNTDKIFKIYFCYVPIFCINKTLTF